MANGGILPQENSEFIRGFGEVGSVLYTNFYRVLAQSFGASSCHILQEEIYA
ncbi:MAG: hypothetical protein ACR2P1_26635 [Pseudomonadales bacterium]